MTTRQRLAWLLGIVIGLMPLSARAIEQDKPGWLLPMPEVDADPEGADAQAVSRPRLGRGHLQPRRDRAIPSRAGRRRARSHAAGPIRGDDRETRALSIW